LDASPPEARIEAIDAIRGIALFGVLMVNLVTAFRVSIFQQFLPAAPGPMTGERIVERIIEIAIEQKAFCLFALLFGIGLGMQVERLAATGRPLYWLARRLGALLVFGLVHLLFIWNGDILTEYAVTGFLVLPLLRLPRAGILAASMIFLVLYVAGPPLAYSTAELQAHVAAANRAYATGGVAEVFEFSVAELPLIFQLHAFVLPRTVGLFLLGAFLWRSGLFKRVSDYTDELGLAAIVGITAGGALTVAQGGAASSHLAPVVLALGYGAALLALSHLSTGRRVLAVFAPVGRMAFTNYVLQSMLFAGIFFGYGFGQFGEMTVSTASAIGVAVYACQVLASRWWVERYRFGPLEWTWRMLMYGAAQPMRRGV
jgi:uncharacterized protein